MPVVGFLKEPKDWEIFEQFSFLILLFNFNFFILPQLWGCMSFHGVNVLCISTAYLSERLSCGGVSTFNVRGITSHT